LKKGEEKKFDSMMKIFRKSSYALFLAVLFAVIYSCTIVADQSHLVAGGIETRTWEEADDLFRGDLRWLGADDAYSIDLKDGRVLWLFGDTFIANNAKRLRSESTFVRNTIGIQTGYDPSKAAITFYWRGSKLRPESFFPEMSGAWHWPGHGIRLDSKLLVFLMVIRKADNELGFVTVGWHGVMISNVDSRPSNWQLTWLKEPPQNFGVLIGSGSVLRSDNYIYAFGYRPATRDIHAVRWHVSDVLAEKMDQPQWWAGPDSGWKAASQMDGQPVPVLADGQSEFSIHYEPEIHRFVEVQSVGFGPAWIAMRSSETLTGPWSPTIQFYLPEEYRIPDIMIYAAKAHPHLIGDGLVLTYVTNSFNFDQAVRNDQIYYPRFLRIHFNSN
jgi:hypothetical protein